MSRPRVLLLGDDEPADQVDNEEGEDTGDEAEEDEKEADDRRVEFKQLADPSADAGDFSVVFRAEEAAVAFVDHSAWLQRD